MTAKAKAKTKSVAAATAKALVKPSATAALTAKAKTPLVKPPAIAKAAAKRTAAAAPTVTAMAKAPGATRAPATMTVSRAVRLPPGILLGLDERPRCSWCVSADDYTAYHDNEWGFPVHDDRRLFEKICLEGFQAGLSWLTVLRKRAAFRAAFASFELAKVASMGPRDVKRLLGDAGIIRHRGKIESTINNAQRAIALVEEHGSLAGYIWTFLPPARERPRKMTRGALRRMASTPTSLRLSKDLKARGWSFVGPTTIYAFMQAMGLVDDHLEGCIIRPAAEAARANLPPET